MNSYRLPRPQSGYPVVKNFLMINGIFFLATVLLSRLNLAFHLGGFYFESPLFRPWQPLTSMFMHGSVLHITFNMFALWMFGSHLERLWGSKRFLAFYFLCGFGAYFLHDWVVFFQTNPIKDDLISRGLDFGQFVDLIKAYPKTGQGFAQPPDLKLLFFDYVTPVVGASGAIYGLLVAFAVYYPDIELMLIFLPVPVKAKYFVPFLILIELFLGWQSFSGDNVAHFAHIGGALIGYIVTHFWRDFNKRAN